MTHTHRYVIAAEECFVEHIVHMCGMKVAIVSELTGLIFSVVIALRRRPRNPGLSTGPHAYTRVADTIWVDSIPNNALDFFHGFSMFPSHVVGFSGYPKLSKSQILVPDLSYCSLLCMRMGMLPVSRVPNSRLLEVVERRQVKPTPSSNRMTHDVSFTQSSR